jgi:hypothetical protein
MNKGVLILKWTVMCILFIFLFGWGTMWLWNWLVPALFNGPVLTFWQTLGLLVLSKILLSGFGGGGWKGRGSMRWKQHYYNKWSAMSSEDRERIKAGCAKNGAVGRKTAQSQIQTLQTFEAAIHEELTEKM